ncbi:uncharacterized protein TNCT_563821 [Trichonephila clavata]|uniref:Uncharacterized protein n=1 Tax=Trichonephila clavata TaxID=2740835 RepID=A0A8X6HS89_TRICU|nr:uncharacterized protein TNCT_563821 [Trichonephila clavata]
MQSKKSREVETLFPTDFDYFPRSVTSDEDGRYEVKLPWMRSLDELRTNRNITGKRQASTSMKLLKSNKFEFYNDVFEEWKNEDFVEDSGEGPGPYLPHRGIFKNVSTTKIGSRRNYVGLLKIQPIRWHKPRSWEFTGEAISLKDPNDLIPLTPSMFIQDIPTVGVPDLDKLDTTDVKTRLKYQQSLRQHLRSRFRSEYLGILLQPRNITSYNKKWWNFKVPSRFLKT